MREIKFRAWDKSDGQMYYAIEDGIQFDDGSVYEFRDFLTPKEDDYHKWEIMQYTGLKDKNGKEIYESDIIKKNDKIYKVVWDGGSFHIEECNGDIFDYLLGNAGSSKIIGNIYENKDLIK